MISFDCDIPGGEREEENEDVEEMKEEDLQLLLDQTNFQVSQSLVSGH